MVEDILVLVSYSYKIAGYRARQKRSSPEFDEPGLAGYDSTIAVVPHPHPKGELSDRACWVWRSRIDSTHRQINTGTSEELEMAFFSISQLAWRPFSFHFFSALGFFIFYEGPC